MAKLRIDRMDIYEPEETFYSVSVSASVKDPDLEGHSIVISFDFNIEKVSENISEIERLALEKAKKAIEQLEF